MTKKNGFRLLGTAVAVAGLFIAQAVSAAPLVLQTGDKITLSNSSPSVGHAGGGGEFYATGAVVANGSSGSFMTFCLEKDEFFSPGSTQYYVKLNTGAVEGGNGAAGTYTGDVGGSSVLDPLSNATAWLYTEYVKGAAGALTGWAHDATHANAMQQAVWYLENEISSVSGLANTWAKLATDAVDGTTGTWTNPGNVYALNLYDSYNAATGQFSGNHQDQLYITPVPEPETYAMLLAGLGLMGFVARRRRKGGAA